MSDVKKLVKILINGIYGFMFICGISYLFSSYKVYKGEEVIPNILGYYGFTINTGSMEPAISAGDYVITKRIKNKDINEGDIISFIEEDTIITHRVMEVINSESDRTMFITKGDGNNTEDDAKVSIENVLSKYIISIPKIGYVLNFIKYTNPLITIGILFSIFLIYLCLKELEKEVKKEDEINESTK